MRAYRALKKYPRQRVEQLKCRPWLAQIALFLMLGLLITPHDLLRGLDVAVILSLVLMFLARPLATFAATALSPLIFREKLMLGWAGLRGATPIWLATFPVVAGVGLLGPVAAAGFYELARRREAGEQNVHWYNSSMF